MKNLKKKLAARGGFTLVELIVVIAILAILAGVGTATYSGYIKRANDAADLQYLSSINTAAQGVAAGKGLTVSKIKVTVTNGVIGTIVVTCGARDTTSVTQAEVVALVFDGTLPTTAVLKGSYASGATWYATESTTQGSAHAAGWVATGSGG